MRVIAGTAGRLQLKTVPGQTTRPTTDRIKETLFNILAPELADCEFLDLFSGSGGIGIEALSRGAKQAYFVDSSRKAGAVIRENLIHTRLEAKGHILIMDAVSAVRSLAKDHEAFDWIFMDPPYRQGLEQEVLYALSHSPLVGERTRIVVESDLDTRFAYLEALPFEIYRVKEYKTNKHTFLRLCGKEPNEKRRMRQEELA